MTHEIAAALAADGPPISGTLAAVYGIILALITAAGGIIVARIQRAKPESPDPQKAVTVPPTYIAELIQREKDQENETIAQTYRVEVLRRGCRQLREWIIRNAQGVDPDTIIDDEVKRNL